MRRASLLLLAVGCTSETAEDASRGATETRGDTVIVRTLGAGDVVPATLTPELSIGVVEGDPEYMFGRIAGLAVAEDGSIYTFDERPPELRRYDPEGRYVATLGRQGSGPGEFVRASGIALRAGGGVFTWDLGSTRLTAFDGDGRVLRETLIPSAMYTPNGLIADTAGHAYVAVQVPGAPEAGIVVGFAHHDGAGTLVDTIRAPDWGYEPHVLVATTPDGRGRSFSPTPFAPLVHWTIMRTGEVASGLASSYRIDIPKRDGRVLRIEKDGAPVPVPGDERRLLREQLTRGMQNTQPDWQWSGPDIPETKPFFQRLHGGIDGSLWVQVHAPSTELPPDTMVSPPRRRYIEPVVFDIFSSDGRYRGRVGLPERTRFLAFAQDRVWAVVRDSLDVESVVRFRIEWPSR